VARDFDETPVMGGFVRPGKALTGVMVALLAVWLLFAIAINWGGASLDLFALFCGNTARILDGEVWRFFTAPFMHEPTGTIGHILFALFGLFFLGPNLERTWGSGRMLRFLALSAIIAYGLQMLLQVVLPASLADKLVGPYWYGSFPVLEAIAIAWALSFRGQTVRLFFTIPVTSSTLIGVVIAMSVLRVLAASQQAEGLLSPFGGMLAGWLLGGGTPSPLRRAYLKLRLAQLDREASRNNARRGARRRDAPLRVIEGGRGKGGQGPDDRGPDDRGPDGRLLN
jgi:membrane associated rhomboid family serine protease